MLLQILIIFLDLTFNSIHEVIAAYTAHIFFFIPGNRTVYPACFRSGKGCRYPQRTSGGHCNDNRT